MDFRISGEVWREKKHEGRRIIDPHDQTSIDGMFSDEPGELPGMIGSHERVLVATEDEVRLPVGLVGMVELRSTWARLGLVLPPTIIDGGFHGHVTVEIFNSSFHHIVLQSREVMISMHVVPLVEWQESGGYKGRYQGQKGIQKPKAFKDV